MGQGWTIHCYLWEAPGKYHENTSELDPSLEQCYFGHGAAAGIALSAVQERKQG